MGAAIVPFSRKPGTGARRPITLPCPKHLCGAARAEWQRVVKATRGARTLAPENSAILEAYCLAFARWRQAEVELAKDGPIILSKKTKTPMHNPWHAVAIKERAAMLRFADQLGFTPRMRGKVEGVKGDGDDGGWGDDLLA